MPIAAASLMASRALSATSYVDASRSDDTGTATNWATAKRTIQAAAGLTAASGDLVLVTAGEYKEEGALSTFV
ncbi:MAG: hypothetical protein PHW60_11650 [Kiritimatiellae bacterium]|nr:hypothetical protein [Kiritimatiellia bacterium]